MSDENTDTVPRARLNEVLAERDALKTKLTQAESRVAVVERTLNTQYQTLTAEHEALKVERERDRFYAAEGIDPTDKTHTEILDYARYRYDALQPEEGTEKPTFEAWFKTARAENPVLKAHFGAPKAPVQPPTPPRKPADAGTAAEPPKATTPRAPAGVPTDPAEIARMDPEAWKANQDAIFASLTAPRP